MESRRIFFSSPGPTKEMEKIYSSSYEGKIEGLSPRLCCSPVSTRGHGTGSIPERAGRCLPAPHGEGRTALTAKCLLHPAPRRAAGRSISRIPQGCWQPEPPAASPEPRTVPEPDAACSSHWGLGGPRHCRQPSAAQPRGMGSWVCPSEPAQDAAGAASNPPSPPPAACALPVGF